jgi:hypothetical protein
MIIPIYLYVLKILKKFNCKNIAIASSVYFWIAETLSQVTYSVIHIFLWISFLLYVYIHFYN